MEENHNNTSEVSTRSDDKYDHGEDSNGEYDDDDDDDIDNKDEEASATSDNGEEDDDDEMNDNGSNSRDSSESSNDGSTSGDESIGEKSEGDEEGGLSALERRRLDRIQRNQELLKELGLANANPSASDGEIKKKAHNRKRISKPDADPKDLRKSSRSSKSNVNYSDLPGRWLGNPNNESPDDNTRESISETLSETKKKRSRKGERIRDQRMELFIYHEFLRMQSLRKQDLKVAEKRWRNAQVEHRFAERRANVIRSRIERLKEQQRMNAEIQVEKRKFGSSLRELLLEIERRVPELKWALKNFQNEYKSPERLLQLEKEKSEQERTMEMIDAINALPNSIKDSENTLDFLLAEQSPKDPLPPRQSDRKRRYQTPNTQALDRMLESSPNPSSENETLAVSKNQQWQKLAAAIAVVGQPISALESPSAELHADEVDDETKTGPNSKKGIPKRKTRNVGGWVSPMFSNQIDRSWLDSDEIESSLNIYTYVPQPGDIVLYYPDGHRDFLSQFPDDLAKKTRNKSRMPLWERAKRDKEKFIKENKSAKRGSFVTSDGINSNITNQKHPDWFDDEWLNGFEFGLGSYPLICRVEKTHAEFPPDPYGDSEIVTIDGVPNLVFKASRPKKQSLRAPLHLAVVLKPLTPLHPPEWDKEHSVLRPGRNLCPPPIFHVVTFPSRCEPFIIPFCHAYRITHQFSLEEYVKSPFHQNWQGVIKSFLSLGEKYGSGRFKDCAFQISTLLAYLEGADSDDLVAALESSLTFGNDHRMILPLAEAGLAIETMTCGIHSLISPAMTLPLRRSDLPGILCTIIRGTLPLWKGVSIQTDDGTAGLASSWELMPLGAARKSPVSMLDRCVVDNAVAENSLVYRIDEPLRAKIELALKDFTERNEESHIFWDPVKDDFAPAYSCAVPQGMCFEKILSRLELQIIVGEEERKLCFYRTVESLLNDVGTVFENCMLYNSLESDVVLKGKRVMSHAKILIEEVVARHQKERAAREKADEERKKKIMLQYNSAACVQPDRLFLSPEEKSSKSRRSFVSNDEESLQGPFNERLDRKWIESVHCDTSWNHTPDPVEALSSNLPVWIPQSGDYVFYSRSLHSEFIKGHQDSLLTEQCILPQFTIKGKYLNNDKLSVPSAVGSIVSNQIPGMNVNSHQNLIQHQARMMVTENNQIQHHDRRLASEFNQSQHQEMIITSETNHFQLQERNMGSEMLAPFGNSTTPLYLPSPNPFSETQNMNFFPNFTQPPPNYAMNCASKPEPKAPNLIEDVNTHWLVGKVFWVRRVFPRNPPKKSKERDTFDVRSPMLCLGIQFNYDWYTGQKLHTVHWRPCFTADMTSKPFIEDWSCQSCGAATNYNFLFPAWLHQSSRLKTFTPRAILLTGLAAADSKCFLEKPKGISCERIASILSCFDVLKRRCIAAIPPDLIPENLSIEATKKSWNLQSKTRSVSIPLLEHIFLENILEGMDRVSDRAAVQIKKSENIEEQLNAVSLLTEIHYLPPFSKASIASKLMPSLMTSKKPSGFTIPFEESMCPSPRLCLEFIRQRLKNGYYRQTTALIDDIQEAYVSTVLLVLFKLNHQKFGSTFSIKKFAKSLIKKGSLKSPFLQKGKTSEYAETWKQQPPELFKDEESWTEKIKLVRSLYAMALVSVSETRYIETIFGLLQRKQIKPIPMQVIEQQKSFLAVSEKISHLVRAFSRDPCSNRGQGVAEVQQPLENRLPSVPVKIILSSNVAMDGSEFPPIIFTPNDYIYFERLSLFFFGKPGRMEACGRCKVVNRSFVGCRIQKGHSNVDFNWDEVMTNVGGVDGLLYSLRTGKPKVLPSIDLAVSTIEKKESDKIEFTNDSDSAFDNPYLEMLSEKDKERMQHFEKASRALSLADNLLRKAKDEVDLPLLLSDEFIENYFPIDPTDGHYNYCTICGLSGDVICCEKCPIVMHRHCAGIVNVPDGDWFCSRCTAKERNVSRISDENLTVLKGIEETTIIEESDVTSKIVDDCQEDPKGSVIVNSLPETRDILPTSNTEEKNSFDVATAGEELDLLLENLKTARLTINPPKLKKKDEIEKVEDEELEQKEHQDTIDENAENQGDKQEDNVNGESERICLLEVTPEPELGTISNSLGVSEVIVSQQEEIDLPRLRSRQSVDPDSSAKESRSRRLNRNQRSLTETEEDELSIFSPENPEPIGIGSKLSKDFGVNGRFLGVVKTLPTDDHPFYYIRYEDGDEEDMDEEELRQVLISIKPPRKRKEKVDIDAPRRKRGRPPKNKSSQS